MVQLELQDQQWLLTLASNAFFAAGYESRLVVPDWQYADIFEREEPDRRVPLAAFGQDPPSYRTSCIGATWDDGDPQHVERLRALGAPQILVLGKDVIERWKIPASGEATLLERLSPGRLVDAFRERREEWGPRTVLRLKGIAPAPGVQQLDFYDAGLIPTIDDVVFTKLDRVLRQTIATARDVYMEHHRSEPDEAELVRLIFRLLTAKVFADRDHFALSDIKDSSSALDRSIALYGDAERLAPILGHKATQDIVWRQIRSSFNLQNISVEALAHVYENTLVTEAHRQATGTHATPPSIAEYIVRNLPFESLSEDQRTVFEPFMGHAVFLISAMSRLRELAPRMSSEEMHRYFVNSLSGMERDAFALEVAKLSLLLADYPNHDGWRIVRGDVLSDGRTDTLIKSASIILGNPPFEWIELGERMQYRDIRTPNPVVEILDRILSAPPAMLGFVLPMSFVDGRSFREPRARLSRSYGRLEVVGLPDTVFKYSQAESMLVMASERSGAPATFRCASVDKDDYASFIRTWIPSWQTESTLRSDDDNVRFWKHPLDDVWARLSDLPRLKDIAEIHRGIEFKVSLKYDRDRVVSSVPRVGYSPGLVNQEQGFEPYYVSELVYVDTSPDALLHQTDVSRWTKPKVIVNAGRLERRPWRLAAVPDPVGLVCTQRFHGVWSKTTLPYEFLSAVLNGYVANAFISSRRVTRDITVGSLNEIPIPQASSEVIEEVTSLVNGYREARIELAVSGPSPESIKRCRSLFYAIGDRVMHLYDLEEVIDREIMSIFRGHEHPAIESLYSSRYLLGSPPNWQPLSGTSSFRAVSNSDAPRPFSEVVSVLVRALGRRLVAIIGQAEDSEVEEWIHHGIRPRTDAIDRLYSAYDIVRMLSDDEADDTIQAWFAGKNSMLGDKAPAIVLGEDPGAVLQAARSFAAYG